MTVSTEVEAIARGKAVLRKPSVTMQDIAEAIADLVPVEARPDTIPFPPVPEPVEITDEMRQALRVLADEFGKVQPETRRALDATEVADLYHEREVLRTIVKVLIGRDETIKEIVRHHIDVDAEARGVAVPHAVSKGQKIIVEATQRDAHGHYVLASKGKPVRVPIDGTNKAWSSEYRAGKDAVEVDGDLLDALFAVGEIDRATYLSFTRERRVLDGDKVVKAVSENPDLLDVLVKITRKSEGVPGTSLTVR